MLLEIESPTHGSGQTDSDSDSDGEGDETDSDSELDFLNLVKLRAIWCISEVP